jgi:hypothetical protein
MPDRQQQRAQHGERRPARFAPGCSEWITANRRSIGAQSISSASSSNGERLSLAENIIS